MGDRVKAKIRIKVSEPEALRLRLGVESAQNATLLRHVRHLESQLDELRAALTHHHWDMAAGAWCSVCMRRRVGS